MLPTKPRPSGLLLCLLLAGCSSGSDSPPPTEAPPSEFSYNLPLQGYPLGWTITPLVPIVTGNVDSYDLATGELPPGLALDLDTGVIDGRPLAAGDFDAVITATNTGGSTSTDVEFQVTLPAATRYVYTADAGDDSVSTWLVDLDTDRLVLRGFQAAGTGPADVALALEGTHLAAANTGSNDLSVWAVSTLTGNLIQVPGSPFPAATEPVSVAFHPSRDLLYAALRNGAGPDTIQTYSFDPSSGALQPLGAPITAGTDLGRVRADPVGRFVFSSSAASGGSVQSWLVGETGELTLVSTLPAGTGAGELATHPSGNFLYCVNTGANTLSSYAVTPVTGTLVAVSSAVPVPGTQAGGAAVSADGLVLHASSADGTVSGFAILATGELITLPGATVSVPLDAGPLVAAPSGMALYVTSGATREVTPIAEAQDGSLSIISPGSVRSRSNPAGITALGGFSGARATADALYVANRGSNDLNQYVVGPLGSLTPLVPPNVLSGTGPEWVEVHPRRPSLYAANASSTADAAGVYSLALLGQATGTQSVAATAGSVALQVEPSGRTAYLVNDVDDTLQAYSIDAQGQLTAAGSPLALPPSPRAGAITPDGKFLYLPSGQAGAISQFAIATDGALAPLVPPTVTATSDPVDVSIDPTGHFLYSAHSLGGDQLRGYAIALDGTLTELAGSPYALTGNATDPADVEVHPAGTHVFAVMRGDSGSPTVRTMQWFLIQGSGDLLAVGSQSLGGTPTRLAIEPGGDMLYVAIEDLNIVELWRILPGLGSIVPSGSVATGTAPSGLGLRVRTQ